VATALIASQEPAVVINAAAYTMVDRAEAEPSAAFAINRDCPAAVSRMCQGRGIPFIHISTDYVFDGDKPIPYVETDRRNPKSVYGRSKSEGEDEVMASGARAAIIRTSWVYAAHGTNFLRTMLRLAESHEEVRVVADQIGRPTWAKDIAATVLDVALRAQAGDPNSLGVFHYTGAGDASWADFASRIFATASRFGFKAARVKRIPTAEYPTVARRPANSRLDTTKIERLLGIVPRDWREGCDLCLSELVERPVHGR
jgi:dTDP-4-dehydrorhamnose reductase